MICFEKQRKRGLSVSIILYICIPVFCVMVIGVCSTSSHIHVAGSLIEDDHLCSLETSLVLVCSNNECMYLEKAVIGVTIYVTVSWSHTALDQLVGRLVQTRQYTSNGIGKRIFISCWCYNSNLIFSSVELHLLRRLISRV